jgi:hypothetical protein
MLQQIAAIKGEQVDYINLSGGSFEHPNVRPRCHVDRICE